jgi:kinesin family protein 2/24
MENAGKLRKQNRSKTGLKGEKTVRVKTDKENPDLELFSMIKKFRDSSVSHPLGESDLIKDNQTTVCVRKRPLNKEFAAKEMDVITVRSADEIVVHEKKDKLDLTKYLENHHFTFDYVFDETCSNNLVYRYTAKPLVESIFEGGMATCFAYGQTGSGKTHTMLGGKTQATRKGICAMAAEDVFNLLQTRTGLQLVVCASFFEIYCGEVFDLLADRAKLRIRENHMLEVQIVGLTERVVDSMDEILQLIEHGKTLRTSAKTSINSQCSRSHAVFQIAVRRRGTKAIHGKLSLIDLAGNDIGTVTSCLKYHKRIEGAEINKSLLALKECIRALGSNGKHIPFRGSKLTHILRDSFIGKNPKTCIIAMVNPGGTSSVPSLNTLRFADRLQDKKQKIKSQIEKQRQQLNQQLQEQLLQDPLESYRMPMAPAQERGSDEGPVQWLVTRIGAPRDTFENRQLRGSSSSSDPEDLYMSAGEEEYTHLISRQQSDRDNTQRFPKSRQQSDRDNIHNFLDLEEL